MVLGFLGLLRDDIGDSYLVILLQKNLIIFTQSNAKDDWSDILEAMNPLLSLTSLATHIKHTITKLASSVES